MCVGSTSGARPPWVKGAAVQFGTHILARTDSPSNRPAALALEQEGSVVPDHADSAIFSRHPDDAEKKTREPRASCRLA